MTFTIVEPPGAEPLLAAHHIALLLLSTAAPTSPEHHEIIEQNGPGVWHALEELGLVESRGDEQTTLWVLSERGQVLVEHVLALPLPEPVRAWRMPGAPPPSAPAVSPSSGRPIEVDWEGGKRSLAGGNLQPGNADSSATDDDDGPAPPRAPNPKPIPGITLAEDPQARRNQARQLLERGYGAREVAETLELPEAEVEQMFFGGR